MMKSVVLFGGTGFIGTHLAIHILEHTPAQDIFLVDFKPPRELPYTRQLQAGLSSGVIRYVFHDVRNPIPATLLPVQPDLIFNLAAIHREPGHLPSEYFETNLAGAENVCAWATEVGCDTIVFTSSISPYGPSEEKKTEASFPTPETPYGTSKLAAENIHRKWQCGNPERRLLLLRPGVVFGPGEGGNVTRLVHSLIKGYFVYLGNRKTIKAAGYVKELCLVAIFGLDILYRPEHSVLLINVTMDPPPTMEQMVTAISKVIGKKRKPFNLPRKLLLALSYPLLALERICHIQMPINPVRVRKLYRSNNISPEALKCLGYRYTYTLESAFRDWMQDSPQDFFG